MNITINHIIINKFNLVYFDTTENELGRIPENRGGLHGHILRDSINSLKLKR